ncbi:MAG: hypothetical protein V3W44_00730 [Dehalococcoidales bacterium]
MPKVLLKFLQEFVFDKQCTNKPWLDTKLFFKTVAKMFGNTSFHWPAHLEKPPREPEYEYSDSDGAAKTESRARKVEASASAKKRAEATAVADAEKRKEQRAQVRTERLQVEEETKRKIEEAKQRAAKKKRDKERADESIIEEANITVSVDPDDLQHSPRMPMGDTDDDEPMPGEEEEEPGN